VQLPRQLLEMWLFCSKNSHCGAPYQVVSDEVSDHKKNPCLHFRSPTSCQHHKKHKNVQKCRQRCPQPRVSQILVFDLPLPQHGCPRLASAHYMDKKLTCQTVWRILDSNVFFVCMFITRSATLCLQSANTTSRGAARNLAQLFALQCSKGSHHDLP